MYETIAVEKNEGIEHGAEHFASLGFRERAVGENLGKIFFGILHHYIQTIPILETAASNVEDPEQIRMRKLLNAVPERELEFRRGAGGDKLDGGFLTLRSIDPSEKNGGVVRAPQILLQAESIVDDLTLALIPDVAHIVRPTARSSEPAGGDTPDSVACDRQNRAAASKAGWSVSTCDSQAPGAGRSSSTFWHEMSSNGERRSYWLGEANVGLAGDASNERLLPKQPG